MKDRPAFDLDRALAGLKDFQRATVDYVFRRMYLDDPPARRFLVADEVGLGKTYVAKGVVAKAIDYLWNEDPNLRIDIVYICSNQTICRQNIRRLNPVEGSECEMPDRITLLPRMVKNIEKAPPDGKQHLNFIAFTPGTSFHLKSSHGLADERALLYWMLPDDWREFEKGAVSLLTGSARRPGFDQRVRAMDDDEIDSRLRKKFQEQLFRDVKAAWDRKELDLFSRFQALSRELGGRVPEKPEHRVESARIVGELRTTLACACLDALEPDLIILDEFQRFRDLLHPRDAASELAQRLFTWEKTRVLLLSATPYKMYTLADESAGDDHYRDFISTVRFLQNESQATEGFERHLAAFRKQIFEYVPGDGECVRAARDRVQETLRLVMARTERLAVTPNRDGFLSAIHVEARIEAPDIASYLALQRVARTLDQPDSTEYWKSAPYLLNFMDDYAVKVEFMKAAGGLKSPELFAALEGGQNALLSRQDLEAYSRIDPANGRLRVLMEGTVGTEAWRVMWLPPSLPYYRLEGPFANPAVRTLTKRLVFSSWQVVPKVVASLLSYEVERRMWGIGEQGRPRANTAATRDGHARLMQFTLSNERPARMTLLGVVYPAIHLAAIADPWRVAGEMAGASSASEGEPTLDEVRHEIGRRVETSLAELPEIQNASGPTDARWYWAAPILLDLHHHERAARAWLGRADLSSAWRFETTEAAIRPGEADADDAEEAPFSAAGWSAHVREAARLLVPAGLELGSPPSDLAEVLALQAVGSPAIAALRALCRVTDGVRAVEHDLLRRLAGQVGHAFLALFDLPEVTELIRSGEGEEDTYWRRVLEYCAAGCLQAVLDEYAHVLVEWTGAAGKDADKLASIVAQAIIEGLGLRAARVQADIVSLDTDRKRVSSGAPADVFRFRTRFAVRYAGQGQEERRSVERQARVQKAFNSPFWPYVLCTTSVGQEGLDFHLYCHAVVHWNLPSNPVDFEQREGRVHRFKGHAVRKNVASRHAAEGRYRPGVDDPWREMFQAAKADREPGASDMVPYWVYRVEGGAQIERHVPLLPFSCDIERAERLTRSLAVYRMAFGQNRQEDLVALLLERLKDGQVEQATEDFRIDLAPEGTVSSMSAGEELLPERGLSAPHAHHSGGSGHRDYVLNLDVLRRMLDRFHELCLLEVSAGDEMVHRASASAALGRFAALLDSFSALRERQPQEEPRGEGVAELTARWRDLLDAFTEVVRESQTNDEGLIDNYRTLLDAFVVLSGGAYRTD